MLARSRVARRGARRALRFLVGQKRAHHRERRGSKARWRMAAPRHV